MDGTYTITDKGRLSNETGVHEIPFTGTIPTGGYLTYENNVLKTGCITMEEYKVNIEDGEITTVEKGKCDNEIVQLKVYATGEEVYYDPVTGEKCGIEDYHVDNSITGFNGIIEGENSTKTTDNQTQCLKWYAFLDEENSVTVDLLLDHNTTPGVSWNKESDCTLGPKDVIDKLHSDTENWSEKLIRNDSHVEKWPGPGDGYTFTVDYNGKKARLISVDEIAHISGLNDWTQSDGNPNVPNEQNWLFDRIGNNCSIAGCPNNALGDATAGYWTVSPSYSSKGSYVVGHGQGRSVIAYFASYDAIGVRPVITINK